MMMVNKVFIWKVFIWRLLKQHWVEEMLSRQYTLSVENIRNTCSFHEIRLTRWILVQSYDPRPPGWRSGYCCTAAPAVPSETLGLRPGCVRGAMHNWPTVVRVRESLTGRDVLTSLHTSDSCGGPGAVKKHLVGLFGLCIGERMTFNLWLSRARTGVVAMRQDSSY